MANTKITSRVIADNSVGIDALNVTDGTNGQVLTTNGAGTLSFSTISGYTDSDVETYLNTSEIYTDPTNNRLGIGTSSPQAGLDLGSSAKGTWSSGNVYSYPTGNAYIKVQGTATEDDWIGIAGNYDQSSGSANLLLQANLRLVNEQAGNYIGSEAQSVTSADITFGKLIGGSSTGVNATKSEFMRIDSSGNVGIGTNSPGQGSSALTTLTVDGAIMTTNSDTSSIVYVYEQRFNGSNNLTLGYTTNGTTHTAAQIAAQNNLPLLFATAGAEGMRIDSSGRVGINRTPAITNSKLEIGGADNVPLINVEASGATAGIGIGAQSGSSAMRFYYGTTERASLNLHGAWKVKSTSGAYFNSVSKYHEINSNDSALTTVLIRNGSTYYANCANFWLYGGAPNNTQSQFWTCNDTAGQKASIQSNGGLHNYQSNNSNLCDEREKKNIEVLSSTWNSVKSWELKKFHYNEDEDSDDKRLGVIAQEIQIINPELITEHTKVQAKDEVLWTEEDDLPEGVSVGDTRTAAQDAVIRKGVKEQQMYIMAIKALQEAMTEIEDLKLRIETLEG